MSDTISLSVIGVPITQGSKSAYPFRRQNGTLGVRVTEGKKSAALADWRRAIADAARQVVKMPIAGPIVLEATFYLPRPRSAPKRVIFPATKPDTGKMLRSDEDALSKIAYEDDARIVTLHVHKRFAIDRPPGVDICIRPATEADL